MARAGSLAVEVVYWPKQTRVYLYGADGRAQSARGVQGQLAMKVYGNDRVFRYPLSYVAPSSDPSAQDYLSAAVNVSRIPDGQMSVAVELANLPGEAQRQARVVQTFALSSLPVVVAALDESDRPRIEQQKLCVVSGGALGSMGTPVKVLVADEPVYLCCRGCLAKLQENPTF